jgi:hypothetical protein
MSDTSSSFLTAWSSFYIMTGSSAAALTGLVFVVITLVNARESPQPTEEGVATFSTPTVMHFAAALLVSAVLVAPWHSATHAGVLTAIVGLSGVAYIVRVTLQTRRISAYTPDLEDWTWFNALPLVAYGAISAGAIGLSRFPDAAFVLGGGVVLLIFIGIRNAWDVVTFIAIGGGTKPQDRRNG